MVWQRNDDQYGVSRKITRIPRASRLAAVGLDQLAMNYSVRAGTNGILDEHELEEVLAQPELIDALVKVERWHRAGHDCARCSQPAENSIIVHDFLVYNPDSASVEAGRAERSKGGAKGNHIRWHAEKGVSVATCDFCAIEKRSLNRSVSESDSDSLRNPPVPEPVPKDLNDTRDTHKSGSVSNARDNESDPKLMARLRKEALIEAELLRIANLPDVRSWLEQASGMGLDMGQAVQLAADVLRRAKGFVREPDNYIIGICRKTPARIAQYADGFDFGAVTS